MPSIPQYKVGVIRFLNWVGNRPINEETLREYFLQLKKDFAPSTVRLAKTSIKLWILKNHPQKSNMVFRNAIESVFRDIKVPKPNISLTDSKLLSEAEIKLLIAKLPHKYSLIIQALYATGCRVSELLGIKLKDCQVLKTHIEVKVTGKGGKENVLILSKELFSKILKEFKGKVYLFENARTEKSITRQLVHRTLSRVGLDEMEIVPKPVRIHLGGQAHLI